MSADRGQTLKFISGIARDMGKPLYVMEHYASGYWIEFPSVVETIMETVGQDAAEVYVRKTFQIGNCQDAFDKTYGRKHPSWCCQKCGAQIGWLGRFFQLLRVPLHTCT
jgi:hypothetical protein